MASTSLAGHTFLLCDLCKDWKTDNERGLQRHKASCSSGAYDADLEDAHTKFLAKRKRKKQKKMEETGTGRLVDGSNDNPIQIGADIPHLLSEDEDVSVGGLTQLAPGFELPPPTMDSEPERDPNPQPELSAAGRPVRKKRPTWKLLELMPEPPAPVPEPDDSPPHSPSRESPEPPAFEWENIRTATNSFGMFREYPSRPTHNPDDTLFLDDLSYIARRPSSQDAGIHSSSRLAPPTSASPTTNSSDINYSPFKNFSIFSLMNWMWTGSGLKSVAEMIRLVDIIQSPLFNKDDLKDFDVKKETAQMDAMSESDPLRAQDGWTEVEVEIRVPDGDTHKAESDAPIFKVPGLHLRSLIEVIKSAVADPSASSFHYTPFRQYWQRPDRPAPSPERVYDEIYSSDAFIEVHDKIQSQPPEPGCTLERVILALMFWSDSTHLANFGDASLWPLYLFFGNLSKYTRGKPRSGACHHVAYIPKIPDTFFDWFSKLTGEGPTSDTLTHCRRELMHAIWALILDPEFMKAYKHGIVIQCPDGVFRRFFPRIFTYSADYPEKVLLSLIRNIGRCPCPRCLVPKTQFEDLGMKRDANRRLRLVRVDDEHRSNRIQRTREFIYESAYGVKSAAVEKLLFLRSEVPTKNTFSERLKPFGFNIYLMLVIDLMHEFELGVWKAVLTHLIRILIAHGGSAIQDFNHRFRQVPSLGRSTIRRFSSNVSAMKKLAARDFEDILQCIMPVFEGLLPPEHDKVIMDLLFCLAEWHALAKLRLHTSSTLEHLDNATTALGTNLRRFKNDTCESFDTRELPKEEAARGRRRKAKKAVPASGQAKKKKHFSMSTPKMHFLGDYVETISWFGSTDSYSTQTGELEHRHVKRFYARTNKNNATFQMARLERREHLLRSIQKRVSEALASQGSEPSPIPTTSKNDSVPSSSRGPQKRKRARRQRKSTAHVSFEASEPLPFTAPDQHYHTSRSRNFPKNILLFLQEQDGQPEVEDFLPKLQEHLLSRLMHPDWTGDGHEFTAQERSQVIIQHNRLYCHKVLRINFTTYDIRREQDSLNPRTHCDIMTLAPDSMTKDHPFAYARILGIFHADVILNISGASNVPVALDFLWIRRFRLIRIGHSGFRRKRLHRVEFLPDSDPNAYGFLNPDEVIRASHLIPAFAHGQTNAAHDVFEWEDDEDGDVDWRYHYVNMFPDRDMYTRYAGGGPGHFYVETEDVRTTERPSDDEDDSEISDTPLEILEQGVEVEMEIAGSSEGSGNSSDSWSSNSDDELSGELWDPEDGEGDGIVIVEDAEGYDVL